MKNLFFLITAIAFIQCFSYAQTNVKIMDVSVISVVKNDSVTGLPVDTTTVNLNVSFKIKNVNEANQAHILYGTAHDVGDIKSLTADFVYENGEYKLTYNGISNVVTQYTATIEQSLTLDEEGDYLYITVYVTDTNGIESNRIYFTK